MLTERLQAAIDREVAGSPRAQTLVAQLEGRSMAIEARYTPWRITLRASAGRVLLDRSAAALSNAAQANAAQANAALAGSPLSLLALLRENPSDVIRRGDVTLTGDARVAEQFQELLQLLRPDLEETLSRVLGDVPAHRMGALLRQAIDYGRSTSQTVATNLGEYLTHERRELVPRAEAAEFLAQVDTLREQVDRVAARVAKLETARNNR